MKPKTTKTWDTLMPEPLVVSPSYSINEFSYRLKLNQRVQAANQFRANKHDYRFLRGVRKEEKGEMQQPLPVVTEKYPNRPCYPPMVAIRRWLYFIAPVEKKYKYKLFCIPCKKEKQKGTNRSAL